MRHVGLSASARVGGATQSDDRAAREKTYSVIGEFIKEFTKRNGTVSCTALLGYNLSDPHQLTEAHQSGVVPARCPGGSGMQWRFLKGCCSVSRVLFFRERKCVMHQRIVVISKLP